jgi:hypothetical protein
MSPIDWTDRFIISQRGWYTADFVTKKGMGLYGIKRCALLLCMDRPD